MAVPDNFLAYFQYGKQAWYDNNYKAYKNKEEELFTDGYTCNF